MRRYKYNGKYIVLVNAPRLAGSAVWKQLGDVEIPEDARFILVSDIDLDQIIGFDMDNDIGPLGIL